MKPTCEGTNFVSQGAGTHANHKCRKSAHEDYKPYCEIHGLKNQIFKLRRRFEEDTILLEGKLSTSRREYLASRKQSRFSEWKLGKAVDIMNMEQFAEFAKAILEYKHDQR
jgi:hypothetical protein